MWAVFWDFKGIDGSCALSFCATNTDLSCVFHCLYKYRMSIFGDEREAYYGGGRGGVMTASYVIYTNTQRIATYQVSLRIYQLNQINFFLGEK